MLVIRLDFCQKKIRYNDSWISNLQNYCNNYDYVDAYVDYCGVDGEHCCC